MVSPVLSKTILSGLANASAELSFSNSLPTIFGAIMLSTIFFSSLYLALTSNMYGGRIFLISFKISGSLATFAMNLSASSFNGSMSNATITSLFMLPIGLFTT